MAATSADREGAAGPPHRLRILLLGDGLWACKALEHLRHGHDLVSVVPRTRGTDDSLPRLAQRMELPLRLLEEVNAPESVAWIRSLEADLLLSVSYDQIFRAPLLQPDSPPILNLHAGDPARHRGRAILCWQLLEGATELPMSVMRVAREIDAGPVLALRTVPLPRNASYTEALEALTAQVPALLDEAIVALQAGNAREQEPDQATIYYPRRIDGDEWIDWSGTAQQAQRLIRALALPNCMARTRLGDRELRVGGAGAAEALDGCAGAPGSVVGRDKRRGLLVRCGDGRLWIHGLAWEDGSPAPVGAFRLSDRLGSRHLAELERLRTRVTELETRLALVESALLPAHREAPHEL